MKNKRGEFRDVAEKIAASLFAGYDGKAQRLVLEMSHGKPAGGWSETCAIGQIEKVLEEYANGGEAVALLSQLEGAWSDYVSRMRAWETRQEAEAFAASQPTQRT